MSQTFQEDINQSENLVRTWKTQSTRDPLSPHHHRHCAPESERQLTFFLNKTKSIGDTSYDLHVDT